MDSWLWFMIIILLLVNIKIGYDFCGVSLSGVPFVLVQSFFLPILVLGNVLNQFHLCEEPRVLWGVCSEKVFLETDSTRLWERQG